MTKAQHEKLKPFEDSFREARADYYRAILLSDVQIMNEIWMQLGNEGINTTCSKCILIMLKGLGELYFNYVEKPAPAKTTKKTNKK